MHLNRGRIWLGGLAGGVVGQSGVLWWAILSSGCALLAAQMPGSFENAALSLLRGSVDCSSVHSVDRGGSSVRLVASGPGTRSGHCAEGRLS